MPHKTSSLPNILLDRVTAFLSTPVFSTGDTGDETARTIRSLGRTEFYSLASRAFENEGYQVADMTDDSGECAADLLLTNGSRRRVVVCREWRAMVVHMPVLEALHNAMAMKRAPGAFILTAGSFSQDVLDLAPRLNIELISGTRLLHLLETGRRP
jgi:HJR/Mrr/RecB family endonuclease